MGLILLARDKPIIAKELPVPQILLYSETHLIRISLWSVLYGTSLIGKGDNSGISPYRSNLNTRRQISLQSAPHLSTLHRNSYLSFWVKSITKHRYNTFQVSRRLSHDSSQTKLAPPLKKLLLRILPLQIPPTGDLHFSSDFISTNPRKGAIFQILLFALVHRRLCQIPPLMMVGRAQHILMPQLLPR